jgi:tetratricopeptide (TPR) repeat protein
MSQSGVIPRTIHNRGCTLALLLVGILVSVPALTQQAQPSFDELVSRAATAREQNDIPHALELYSQAVRVNPKWADGWWFIGSLGYGSGDYVRARDALSQYIGLTSNTGPALALRGLCEFEVGDYSTSAADIQKALSLGAANQSRNEQILRYHEAMALTRLGRFQDALKSYSYFAEQKISSPELMIAIGLAGLRMPLLPQDATSDQQPLLAAAGNATFQFMAGDENGSEKAFEYLFHRFPSAPNAHYLYGSLLFTTDPDASVSEFRRELEIIPNSLDAAIMGAWVLLLRNRPAEALPLAEKAVSLNPESAPSELAIGRALLETGDLAGSIEHLQHAHKLDPDNLEVHIALAKAYSKSGQNNDARRERMLCLQLTQSNATTSPSP